MSEQESTNEVYNFYYFPQEHSIFVYQQQVHVNLIYAWVTACTACYYSSLTEE